MPQQSRKLLHESAESNVATDRTFSVGPVDEAFAAADRIVTGEYRFPRYSSVPMECSQRLLVQMCLDL